MKQIQFVLLVATLVLTVACNAQKNTSEAREAPPANQRGEKGPPSVDEIFKMDSNKDGKLSKSEVKGPLLNDFSKVDANNDGFISKEELANMPKPQRGQRPPRK